jgi:hypothetical protein
LPADRGRGTSTCQRPHRPTRAAISGLYAFRTGEVDRYLVWFAAVLCRSAEATTAVIASLDELLSHWRERLKGLRADALARQVLDLLPAHPVISAAVVVRERGARQLARLKDVKVEPLQASCPTLPGLTRD